MSERSVDLRIDGDAKSAQVKGIPGLSGFPGAPMLVDAQAENPVKVEPSVLIMAKLKKNDMELGISYLMYVQVA